jgi:tetratricopeptide (TPR) repeat protein
MGLPLVALLLVPWWTVVVLTLLGVLLWAGFRSRVQVVVEPFDDYRDEVAAASADGGTAGGTRSRKAPGTAVLLASHLAEMRQLYGFVDDPDALPGRIGPSEATVQLHDVADVLGSAVTAETSMSVAGVTFPVGGVMRLLGRFVQAPRLRGALHSHAGRLVVTAELTMKGEPYSWRVERAELSDRAGAEDDGHDGPHGVDAMMHDLALRVFSDLTLGGQARWPATKHWLEALRALVECQRTHRGDVLKLRRAEYDFTKAASEDEDFYLAYLNLGIVYRRLGAACARSDYRQAARRVLERAIALRADRWEAYHALADVMLLDAAREPADGPPPYETVIGLCDRALALRPSPDRAAQARILDLKGHAQHDSPQGALLDAGTNGFDALRAAAQLALRELAKAELCQARPRQADRRARLRKQAAQSLLQLAFAYARHAAPPAGRAAPLLRRRQSRPFRAIRSIANLAVSLSDVDAAAHEQLALVAIAWSRLDVAEAELASAARIAPASARCAARLASVLAMNGKLQDAREASARAERLVDFASEREERELVVEAYRALGDASHADELERRGLLSEELSELSSDPTHARAELERLLHGYRRAERHWESARVRYELGVSYLASAEAGALGDASKAERELGKALGWFEHSQPGDVRILGLHGLIARAIAMQPGRTGDALRYATRSVVLDPLSHWDRATLADVLATGDDLVHACEMAEHALLLEPNMPDLHLKLAFHELALAQTVAQIEERRPALRRACAQLHEALELYDDDDTERRRMLHWWLARSHFYLREIHEASPHLLAMLSLTRTEAASRPERGIALLGRCTLGAVQRKLGNFAAAEQTLRAALKEAQALRDDGAPITLSLGALADDGSWPLWQLEAFALNELAGCHADRDGDLAAARDRLRASEAVVAEAEKLLEAMQEGHARDVLQDDVDDARANIHAEHGRLLLTQGRYRGAVQALRQATRLDSTSADVYVSLARAYAATARAEAGAPRAAALRKGWEACARARQVAGVDDPDAQNAAQVEHELATIASGREPVPGGLLDALAPLSPQAPVLDGGSPA